MDVLIIGGGLCGLATAIAVTLAGHRATLLEAAAGAHEFGAGLQSSPNGTRLYQKWGLAPALAPLAAAPQVLEIRSADGGRVLARRDHYDAEIAHRYGHPLWTLHRVDLQQALLRRATALGVVVKFASRVVDLAAAGTGTGTATGTGTGTTETGTTTTTTGTRRPCATLENGDEYRGDLVVVADGVWSSLSSRVLLPLGTQSASASASASVSAAALLLPLSPQPTGDMAYRIVLDATSVAEDDPALAAWLGVPRVQIWVGPRAHAVAYSVRECAQLNVVLLVEDDFAASAQETRRVGDVAEMRARFEGWDPLLTKILSRVDTVAKWRLMSLPPLPTWRSEQGTCVLAGDCCHAILPYMAQGLNMGLEDAAVLGALLGHVTSAAQLPQATALYEGLRRARTARMLRETQLHARYWHEEDAALQERRRGELARSWEEGSTWTHPKEQQWIWSYDAYKEAEVAYCAQPF